MGRRVGIRLPIGTSEKEGAQFIPGVIIYRFESSLVFFHADYFGDRVRSLISGADPKPHHFLVDAEAMTFIDISGASFSSLCGPNWLSKG